MKKLLFILFFTPTLLFAQSDSVKTFQIDKISACINGKTKGSIRKSELAKAKILTLKGKGTEGYKITSFTMTMKYIWNKNCDTLEAPLPIVSNSDRITNKMLTEIKGNVSNKACYKRLIIFSNIACKLPDNSEQTLDNISFIVTEDY